MKVLFITNRSSLSSFETMTHFKKYCEAPDLFVYRDLHDAKDFLSKQLIGEQKHLDLIITDWNFKTEYANTLVNWIRNSPESYSAKNFQLRSIPVLLIEDTETQSSAISEGFDGIVIDFPINHLSLTTCVKSSVKAWRYKLADDLDLIGLDPKTQRIYPSHRSSFSSYYKLNVLSREFVDKKSKRLNYIWTNSDYQILNDANHAFFDKMEKTMKHPPKYLEKEFHSFFLSNPTFIKGEDFSWQGSDMLYEKHFYYKDGTLKHDEPDFVNKPHEYAMRFPEVFEIKRQSQKLLR